MPVGYTNLEWLNHNSQRSYPLASDATKTDTTGSFVLPDSFLLELYFPAHAGLDVDPSRFFLRSVAVFANGYNLSIGYDDDSADPPIVASVNIARSTHTENQSYALPGSNDFDDSVGKVVLGKLEDIDNAGSGQYLFDPEGGRLDPDTIRPMIRGISSLTLLNGNDRSEPIYGDIELVAGANMRLTLIDVAGEPPQVRFDAIEGEGLTDDCVCDGDPDQQCIYTINGIPPLNGNFTLVGNDCLEIDPLPHGLHLRDRCSEPCCGCTELEAITDDLEKFGDNVRTLESFLSRLEGQVNQMNQVVMGSKLGDEPCVEC